MDPSQYRQCHPRPWQSNRVELANLRGVLCESLEETLGLSSQAPSVLHRCFRARPSAYTNHRIAAQNVEPRQPQLSDAFVVVMRGWRSVTTCFLLTIRAACCG